jgi:hypothetical protein
VRVTRVGVIGGGIIALSVALALACLAAPAAAHQRPGPDSCTPPKDSFAGQPVQSANVEYLGWLPGEAGDMTAGGRLVGRYFYMSGASHISIYDTLNPESPKLVSRIDFGCRFENEDIAVDGRSLVYSDFSLTRALYVYDVRDPANPKLISEVPEAGRHTMQCVLDCRYLYGSYQADNAGAPLTTGLVVDLADPASPKVLGDWTANDVLPSRKVHDVNEVAPGIVVAAAAPIQVMDVRGDPLKPKVLGRSPDETKRYHSVEWPRGGKDRWMMAMFETNATPRCEAGVGDFTVFDASGVGTTGKIELASSYFLQNTNDDKSQGNPEVNAGLGCSPHWFQVRPSWHDGGIVAMASYDHGLKLLRVDGKGQISEAGHFRAPGSNAAGAYWITCDVVYIVDYTRGLDVVKFKDAATDCATPPAAPPANAPPPSTAACAGRSVPTVHPRRVIRRAGRVVVRGRAVPGACGGRIAHVDVALARVAGRRCRFVATGGALGAPRPCRFTRAPVLRARGGASWTLRSRRRLPAGRYRAFVRATDAFGNTSKVRKVR